jgi:hypothetical protein
MAGYANPQEQAAEQKVVAGLPADVQTGLNTALLRQALAQSMLQRGMQPLEGHTIQTGGGAPNFYVRPSALQGLAGLANTALGANALAKSQSDIGDIMRGYQGKLNKTSAESAQQLGGTPNATSSSGGSSLPSSASIVQSPGLTSDQVIQAFQTKKGSGIPQEMADADKLIPLISSLRDAEIKSETEKQLTESRLANERNLATYKPGADIATPESLTKAANASGVSKTPLQAPGQPSMQMVNGVLTALDPHTNKPYSIAENPLPTAMTRRVQEAQLGIVDKRMTVAETSQDQAIEAGNAAAMGKALQEIIPKAKLGPAAMPRAEIARWQSLLGFPLPPNATYTQLAHRMALDLISAAKKETGLQGRLTQQEANWFREATGANLDITAPALMQLARNAEMAGNMMVANHNRKMQRFEAHATANKVPGAFSPYQVTPDMIAPVGTGEAFMEEPGLGASTSSGPPTIDLRGKIKAR